MSDRFDLAALEAATRGHTPFVLHAENFDFVFRRINGGWAKDSRGDAKKFVTCTLHERALLAALLRECRRLTDENARLKADLRALLEMPEAAQAWVPVADRLPVEGQIVLLAHKDGMRFIGQRAGQSAEYHNWWSDGRKFLRGVITHWRPLPAPPQGGPT